MQSALQESSGAPSSAPEPGVSPSATLSIEGADAMVAKSLRLIRFAKGGAVLPEQACLKQRAHLG